MQFIPFLQAVGSIGAAVFLAVMVIGNYRRGDSQSAKEALELREKQIQALRDAISENRAESKDNREKMQLRIDDLTREIGNLNGQMTSKDGEIKRLQDILTNRNPEMETFFKQVSSMIEMLPRLLAVMDKLDNHITAHKD